MAQPELEAPECPFSKCALVRESAGLRLCERIRRELPAVVFPSLRGSDERQGAEESALGIALAGLTSECQSLTPVLGGSSRAARPHLARREGVERDHEASDCARRSCAVGGL